MYRPLCQKLRVQNFRTFAIQEIIPFVGENSTAFCLCRVDGSSLILSDKVLLKGDVVSCNLEKPRKEPCRSSMLSVAWGRCTAYGLSTFLTGTGSVRTERNQMLVGLEFNKPINYIKDMSSGSVHLTTLFQGGVSPLGG